jgi:hypothetical protein
MNAHATALMTDREKTELPFCRALPGHRQDELPWEEEAEVDTSNAMRTCPAPTPFAQIRRGDRIRWQQEGMDVELEAVVVARCTSRLVTDSGREVLPFHYIVRLGPDGEPEPGETTAERPPEPAASEPTFSTAPRRRYPTAHWREWTAAATARIDAGDGIATALAATNHEFGTEHGEASYRHWCERLGLAPKLNGQALRLRSLVAEGRPRTDTERGRFVRCVNAGVDKHGLTVPEALARAKAELGLSASEKLYYQWRNRLDLPLRTPTSELVRRRRSAPASRGRR